MAFTPSPQQQAVFDWTSFGTGSAVVEAVAGAGKTTTLIGLLTRTAGSVAVCAYNKAIAKEIDGKIPDSLRNRVKVGTVHSFGFGALRRSFPRAKVDGKKLQLLADEMFGTRDEKGRIASHAFAPFAVAATSMAKQVGIGSTIPVASREAWLDMVNHYDLINLLPEGEEQASLVPALRMACQLLAASWKETEAGRMVDFDDMVYEPVRLGLRIWQNDWVLVDEAQDTNATRRQLARMMLRPGGRLVAVGDPRQAIYGFTGADADALDLIRKEFNATSLPLTVTYRCPKAVVRVARRWVSHIEAAETAPEGEALAITQEQFEKDYLPTLTREDAILCRNTAPIVALAYRLLRAKVPCRVEGRSIGEGLIALARRWKVKTVTTLLGKVEAWREKEIAKALAAGKETKAGQIEDQADTLVEICKGLPGTASVDELVASIQAMFGDTPEGEKPRVLTLATIHRSKGREWPRVFWWGPNRFNPSKYARQEWQLGQEDNLCYVAATRAQETLVEVNVPTKKEGG